jgi:hypothetical protein
MKGICAATIFLVVVGTGVAAAQTLDQTFDQLGAKLQDVQKSLSESAVPGKTIRLPSDVPVYTRPEANAVTSLKLNANTPVTVEAVENGFAKVKTPGTTDWYFVQSSGIATASSVATQGNQEIKAAMEKMKGIADLLQNNPYIRLKGFSVVVSMLPSLNIDFEMRSGPNSPAPPIGVAPQLDRK